MISHLFFSFYFSKMQGPWLRSIRPSFKQLTESLNERHNFPYLPTQAGPPEDDSHQVLNHPCEVPHWPQKEGSDEHLKRAMSTCTHHSALQFLSNLIPSHKKSCPLRHTTDDPWASSASRKLFSPSLTALCSDNRSVESLLRSRGKKLSCYYIVTFHEHPKSNFWEYFK